MRSPKDSDSPSGYDREIRPRWRVYDTIRHQEQGVRRLTDDRWWRRVQALMPSEEPVVIHEFDTDCTLWAATSTPASSTPTRPA